MDQLLVSLLWLNTQGKELKGAFILAQGLMVQPILVDNPRLWQQQHEAACSNLRGPGRRERECGRTFSLLSMFSFHCISLQPMGWCLRHPERVFPLSQVNTLWNAPQIHPEVCLNLLDYEDKLSPDVTSWTSRRRNTEEHHRSPSEMNASVSINQVEERNKLNSLDHIEM